MLFSLTNPEVAILMMGIFLFAVLLGFPIAFTLMAMGLGFGYYAYFDPTKMEHLFDNRIFHSDFWNVSCWNIYLHVLTKR